MNNILASYKKKLSNLSKEEKISIIEKHFKEILNTLGLNLNDDSLKNTPKRVAKMYVNELFYGLDKNNFPKTCFFDDFYSKNSSSQKVINIKNITLNSMCEHHFLPMIGYANISYIPNKKIIGLSKINRIVDYYAKKPNLQEKLTEEIGINLMEILDTPDIYVYTSLKHLCVSIRGVSDNSSITTSTFSHGSFLK